MRRARIGTRGSALALAQARIVMDAIALVHPELEIELCPIRTIGDVDMRPFADVSDPQGIKGLFTLELERALLEGEIDLAVHSLKDVPMRVDERLPIVAYARRGDARDALVLPLGAEDLVGAIGTSSARRRAQLGALFPGREVVPVRGNVETRLRKLDEGQFGALVLAVSGLARSGLAHRISRAFSIEEMVPAAGQGILACQGRAGDPYSYLDAVRDRGAEDCAKAERAFASASGSGCARPVGAHASLDDAGQILTLIGFYEDGRGPRRDRIRGPREDASALGAELADRIRSS